MASSFHKYTLHYQSGGETEAVIDLFDGDSLVGILTFHKDGAALPPNVLQEGGVHAAHYHISRFRDVLQILHFEKPLHIRISGGVADVMSTGFEPVGEQEGH